MDGKLKAAAIVILGALLACLCVPAQILNVIIGTAGSGSGQSFSFYVSQSTGSDSNPGTQALPFKTIAKVNGLTLTAGQSVGLMKGDMWRETLSPGQSGTVGSPITYGAYGAGAAPIINASDLVGPWTQAVAQETGGVFSSGLETENSGFTAQFTGKTTAGTNTVALSSAVVNHGVESALVTSDGTDTNGFAFKNLSTQPDVWLRFYVQLDAAYDQAGTSVAIGGIATQGSAQYNITFWLSNLGSGIFKLTCTVRNGSTFGNTDLTPFSTMAKGAWYEVAVHFVQSATVGGAEWFVNGVSKGSNFTLNTSTATTTATPNELILGYNSNSWTTQTPVAGAKIYFDDIKMATSDPGPYSGPPSNSAYYATWSSATTGVFSDNSVLPQATSLPSMIAGQSFFDSGASLLYVWESNGLTPTGRTVEAAVRSTSVGITGKNYITLQDLQLEKNNSSFQGGVHIDGQSTESTGVVVQRCTVDYTVGGLYVFSANSVSFLNNTVYGSPSVSISGVTASPGSGGASLNLTVSGNTIHDVQIGMNVPDGSANVSSGTISNNTVYNVANNGININQSTGLTISGNLVYNGGLTFDDTAAIHIEHTTNSSIVNNTVHDWHAPAPHVNGSGILPDIGSDTILIAYNLSYNNDTAGITVTDATNIDIYNNTLWNNGRNVNNTQGTGIWVGGPSRTATGSIENNIVQATPIDSTARLIYFATPTEFAGFTFAHNDWWLIGGGNWWFNGTSNGSSLATWNAQGSVNADLNSDPLMVDPSTGNFNLQPGSPAINAGICITGITPCPTNIGAK